MHRPTMVAAVVQLPPWCPTPGSSYPLCSCSHVYLIDACIRDGFDGRSFSSVEASQMFSRVIVITVTIVTTAAVVVAPLSALPAMAVTSITASIIFVFAPAPPRVTAGPHSVLFLFS